MRVWIVRLKTNFSEILSLSLWRNGAMREVCSVKDDDDHSVIG